MQALTYLTAYLYEYDEYHAKEISMCKSLGARLAFEMADEAMQVMTGYGFMME